MKWNVAVKSTDPRFYIAGTVLNWAYCGDNSRFCVRGIRQFDEAGKAVMVFRVSDAHMVSDADLEAGKSVPVIAECRFIGEIEQVIKSAEGK